MSDFLLVFLLDKVVKLGGGGSVINGATPSCVPDYLLFFLPRNKPPFALLGSASPVKLSFLI